MAIVEGQKVKVKWNGRNKQHFIDRGYIFTTLGDEFTVLSSDLTSGSDALVEVMCDYCGEVKSILYNQYYKQVIERNLSTYGCKDCASERNSDLFKITKKGFVNVKQCQTRFYQNIVYAIDQEKFDSLNNDQRILLGEIIRFCEEKGKFPSEKEMSNKNGYVSRTQFYKFFNTKKFTDIYDYVYPLQSGTIRKDILKIQKEKSKPDFYECHKCNVSKEFTSEYFRTSDVSKFGLKTTCKECDNKYANLLRYKHNGIIFEEFSDIPPVIWWEHLHKGTIGYLPDFCLEEQNIIKIVRHVFLEKLKLTKEGICTFNLMDLKKYKIFHLYTRYYDKLQFLNLCFPEMGISTTDLLKTKYNDDNIKLELIDRWIKEGKYSIEDLLDHNYESKSNMKIESMISSYFNSSYINMLLWYFNAKRIKHPKSNNQIEVFDFKHKSNGFWNSRENRIKAIKDYCEENGISDYITSTVELKKWIKKFFNQNEVSKIFDYHKYYKTLYEMIVDAYPVILDDMILFSWEWHQVNINTRESLIKALREMLLYREYKTKPNEIVGFLRHSTLIKKGYTKFTKHVSRKRFNNYYEWACLSFPEYKNQWKLTDFYDFIAQDGTICDSLEEVEIYEFIKFNLGIENVKSIGTLFEGEHIFKLPENSKDKWYCPDFIIEGNQNVYIEYFGLYTENPKNSLLTSYRDKTLRKIKYYNSQPDNFIYLFPNDIKNSFEGLIKKFKEYNIIS